MIGSHACNMRSWSQLMKNVLNSLVFDVIVPAANLSRFVSEWVYFAA